MATPSSPVAGVYLFCRASAVQLPRDRALAYSDEPCEFRRANCGSVKNHPTSVAAIAVLFFNRRPLHISRLVIAVYVNAINGMRKAGATANVLKESGKRILPLLAHFYTSPSIVLKSYVIRIKASLLHLAPRFVFRRAFHSMLVVGIAAFAAAFCAPASKTVASGNYLSSALAAAFPTRMHSATAFAKKRYNNEFSEHAAWCDLNSRSHGSIINRHPSGVEV